MHQHIFFDEQLKFSMIDVIWRLKYRHPYGEKRGFRLVFYPGYQKKLIIPKSIPTFAKIHLNEIQQLYAEA